MRPLQPHLSTSWGSGKPAAPAPDAPTSTSWGSGSRSRRAGMAVTGLLAVSLGAAVTAAAPSHAQPRTTAGSGAASRTGAVRPDGLDDRSPGLQGLSAARAVGATRRATGAGQRVAVLDSGVDAVPALAGRVTRGADLTGQGYADRYGHGTFVAGLIAGDGLGAGGRQTQIRGIAPQARIVSVKVIRDDGTATVGALVGGLTWVLVHHTAYRIGVVNLSLSASTVDRSADASRVDGMVEALWRSGVVVVASAGNDGGPVVRAPGDDPTILTVGADYTSGPGRAESLASFSDRGRTGDGVAKPELVAPGVHLRAPLPAGSVLAREQTVPGLPAGYGQLSGTSMSSAVVSGAAAALIAQQPWLTPAQVKADLVGTAGGRLDALRLAAALSGARSAVSRPAADPAPSRQLLVVQQLVAGIGAWTGVSAGTVWTQPVWTHITWPAVAWASSTWTASFWADAVWSEVTWSDATWSNVTWSDSAAAPRPGVRRPGAVWSQ